MAWNHRGFEIELYGAHFGVTINGKRVNGSSLKAAQKLIDKHLDAKAQEVVLNLPVVILRKTNHFYEDETSETEIVDSAITGIDPEYLTVQGIKSPPSKTNECILPCSEENRALLHHYLEAKVTFEAAQKAVSTRSVDTHFGRNSGYGRSKKQRTYAEALELLQKSYDGAVKAEND